MIKHENILAAKFVRVGGAVIDMNPNLEAPVVVFTEQSVNAEYFNLLRAASFMYHTIELHKQSLERIITLLEAAGQDDAVPPLLTLQTGLDFAHRMALEGVEAVAKNLQPKKF